MILHHVPLDGRDGQPGLGQCLRDRLGAQEAILPADQTGLLVEDVPDVSVNLRPAPVDMVAREGLEVVR